MHLYLFEKMFVVGKLESVSKAQAETAVSFFHFLKPPADFVALTFRSSFQPSNRPRATDLERDIRYRPSAYAATDRYRTPRPQQL